MKARARFIVGALAGAALVGAHIVVFPVLVRSVGGDTLRVRTSAPRVADTLDTEGDLPSNLADRVTVDIRPGGIDASSPGMHRIEWGVRYRGGFERRVGRTQLVGPFQDPQKPPCAMRILLGQSLLDGRSQRFDPGDIPFAETLSNAIEVPQEGSLALLIASMVEREMTDFDQWPIGSFRGVRDVRMRWVRTQDIDGDARQLRVRNAAGSPAHLPGILRTTLTLTFDDGNVPVWIGIIPTLGKDGLTMAAQVEAELDLDSWFYQWIADLFSGDDKASKTAQSELDHALKSALSLPPPIDLGDGHKLRFAYCDSEPMEIVTGRYASIPLYLIHESQTGVAPVLFGPAALERPLSVPAPVAIEFEVDALNGILHALWRSGFLDKELDQAGLSDRFNNDPLVRDLLSVRVGDIDLALPPTLWQSGRKAPDMYLGVEADVQIIDRDTVTSGHIFGAVGIAFRSGDRDPLIADVTLDSTALTCEPEPGLLTPCYNDLVQAFSSRADVIHGALSRRFSALFSDIVLGRRIDLQEASFRIDRAAVHTHEHMPTAVVRVDLFGRLHPESP